MKTHRNLFSPEAVRIRARIAALQRRLMRHERISPGICDQADRMRACKTPRRSIEGGAQPELLILLVMCVGIWMLIIGAAGMWCVTLHFHAAPTVFVAGQTLFIFSWLAVAAVELCRRNP